MGASLLALDLRMLSCFMDLMELYVEHMLLDQGTKDHALSCRCLRK